MHPVKGLFNGKDLLDKLPASGYRLNPCDINRVCSNPRNFNRQRKLNINVSVGLMYSAYSVDAEECVKSSRKHEAGAETEAHLSSEQSVNPGETVLW